MHILLSYETRFIIFDPNFIYFHSMCILVAKALVSLHGCVDLSKTSLVAFVISSKIS